MIKVFEPEDVKPFMPSVVDIETAPDGQLICLGYAYENIFGKVEYHVFTTWEAWLKYLIRLLREHKYNKLMRKKLLYIYAHNGANFDWLSLIRFIADNKIAKDINFVMSGSSGIGVSIELHNKMRIHLRDSMRLMPGSLATLTSQMSTQIKKRDIPKHYKSDMQSFFNDEPELAHAYLKDDVLSLQQVIYKFWSIIYEIEGSIGYLPMTLPALAMKVFRKNLGDKIISTPWNKDVKGFTRRAYTGGRVECYKAGVHEHVKVYDVNSMYPFAMYQFPVPSSHRAGWTSVYLPDKTGFYEIEYTQTDTSIPPILRDEKTNDFEYTGSGVYAVPEINLFLEHGTITIVKGLIFQHSDKLFEQFIGKYYNLRREAQEAGNEALSYVCKIMMNSLYGKFGQRGIKSSIIKYDYEKIKELIAAGALITVHDEFASVLEQADVEHEFTAIAAYITAYARVELYKHILASGEGYIYSDTDSVHITEGELETSTGLGALKLETEGKGAYLGKKLYSIKGDKKQMVKLKGIGRMSKTIKPSHALVSMIASGRIEKCTLDFYCFPTVKEVLEQGKPPCQLGERKRTIRMTGRKRHGQVENTSTLV